MTAFLSYFMFISFQEGRLAGVRLRQRVIRSSIPGEKSFLLRIGFLVGSKEGSSLVIILCIIKPSDQMSIF